MYPASTADAKQSIASLDAETILRSYALPRSPCPRCGRIVIPALSLEYEPGEKPPHVALLPLAVPRRMNLAGERFVIAAWSRKLPPFVVRYDGSPDDADEPLYTEHRCTTGAAA